MSLGGGSAPGYPAASGDEGALGQDPLLSRYAHLPIRTYEAGEVLIQRGAVGGDVLVLVSGEVAVEVAESRVVAVSEPGAFFGEMSVLLGRPTSADVVATEPTVVHVLQDAAAVFAERPDLLLEVARLLARRVAAMTSYLVDLREQYADAGGHLALMDVVLSAMLASDPRPADPGSDREVPDD